MSKPIQIMPDEILGNPEENGCAASARDGHIMFAVVRAGRVHHTDAMEPDDAEGIAKMLLGEVAKARQQRHN